jgi:hypothetical protein
VDAPKGGRTRPACRSVIKNGTPHGRWYFLAQVGDPQGQLAHRVFYEQRYPESPSRPVWSALRSAFLQRCDRFDQFLSAKRSETSTVTSSEARNRMAEMKAICREWLELSFWIDPDPPPLAEEEVYPLVPVLIKDGMGESAEYLMKHIGRRPRAGSPARSRDLAIRALELKSSNPTLSWRGVAQRLCACNKATHDKQCAELIRREVIRLQQVLKRYSVQIPA